MTPNGQIIADNGTIISVPNSSRPAPSMHMPTNTGLPGKSGPLHAMQNMRSALVAEPGIAHQAAAVAIGPPKKKRPPQGDKKKKPKVILGDACVVENSFTVSFIHICVCYLVFYCYESNYLYINVCLR